MKKIVLIIIAVLVIGGGAAAFVIMNDDDKNPKNDNKTQSSAPTENEDVNPNPEEMQAAENQVDIEDFAFTPETITVKKGTTVTWTNKDSAEHTVTPDEEDAFEGSELLAQGESFSMTFDETGTFTYHCQPHPQMTGTVVVTE